MAENDTLLAHMVPSNQGEVSASKALAYILNQSNHAIGAFNDFVRETIGKPLKPITRAAVEIGYVASNGKTGRLDLVGYDENRENRVIVEAKFWAKLQEGQGSSYRTQLASGTAVLLYVVPDIRINYLWGEVTREVAENGSVEIHALDAPNGIKAAKVESSGQFLVMLSWRNLLLRLYNSTAEDAAIQADIRQLQGLVYREDTEEFRPIHQEDLGPRMARLLLSLRKVVSGAVEDAKANDWADMNGLRYWQSYDGAYIRFSESKVSPGFGIYRDIWARGDTEDTPLWLYFGPIRQRNGYLHGQAHVEAITEQLALFNFQMHEDSTGFYAPIRLKAGAEYDDVVDDVVAQLKAIADAINSVNPES